MTFRSKPPTLRITDPEHAHIAAEVRVLGWEAMRDLARLSDCTCEEKRIGLITKRFTMRGDEPALQKFVRLAWNDETIGKQFRAELRNAVL